MPSIKRLRDIRKKLRNAQAERERLISPFYDDETLIAGTYAEVFIRCGKPSCHCHMDGGHFATRLSRWVNGKLKSKIVRIADRQWVQKATERYKLHKQALKKLRTLQKTELKILSRILDMKTGDYR